MREEPATGLSDHSWEEDVFAVILCQKPDVAIFVPKTSQISKIQGITLTMTCGAVTAGATLAATRTLVSIQTNCQYTIGLSGISSVAILHHSSAGSNAAPVSGRIEPGGRQS
jgi:hypothetical protein